MFLKQGTQSMPARHSHTSTQLPQMPPVLSHEATPDTLACAWGGWVPLRPAQAVGDWKWLVCGLPEGGEFAVNYTGL